jgi:hypothetical protein
MLPLRTLHLPGTPVHFKGLFLQKETRPYRKHTNIVLILVLLPLQNSNANDCTVVLIRGNQMSIMPSIVQIMISPTFSAFSLLWIQIVAKSLFKNESLPILWEKLISED